MKLNNFIRYFCMCSLLHNNRQRHCIKF